ncbi:MAG: hypothetical protein GX075_12600 [Firmicutes bacterium]|nr:hypothetical protein [Bacillota bacterium]
MKRSLITVILLIFVSAIAPVISAESGEDFHPIRPGMKITFMFIIEHIVKPERLWSLNVVKSSYPESLTYTWTRPHEGEQELSGTRILTDLKYSRDFDPWYKNGESKATKATAPWIAREVLKELRKDGTAGGFRVCGAGAANWIPRTLQVKEKIVFPLTINGKTEVVHALKLNLGLVVWNNLNNPLVLEYEPLGIPLITGITGWRVKEINY